MSDEDRQPDDSRWETFRSLANMRRFARDPNISEDELRDFVIEVLNMYEALTTEHTHLNSSLANRCEEIVKLSDENRALKEKLAP